MTFASEVTLKGWFFEGEGEKRGTVIYLHGIGDNRESGIGIADRFVNLGFDVLLYDSRAHGESGGEYCTYGFFETEDLSRILDSVQVRPVILLGVSMGGAVGLQAAARDSRIKAVIAVATFSDLRSAVANRAPFFITRRKIEEALKLAEKEANFSADRVNVVTAAAAITIPVLLIHGAVDRETPPLNSEKVYGALRGHKRLILVDEKGHDDALTEDVWHQIDSWIETEVTA